jgi:hypothetical protein
MEAFLTFLIWMVQFMIILDRRLMFEIPGTFNQMRKDREMFSWNIGLILGRRRNKIERESESENENDKSGSREQTYKLAWSESFKRMH